MPTETQHLVTILVPVMTKELFSVRSGMRPGQIKGQAERGNLETIRIGRLGLVNIAKLLVSEKMYEGLSVISTPTMTAEQFALHSGLTQGQVETQLTLHHLPRREVGRLVLVDVAELYRICLSEETKLTAV